MKYRVKVTEKHSDYVWVDANSREDAKRLAMFEANCEFECIYSCEVVNELPDGNEVLNELS